MDTDTYSRQYGRTLKAYRILANITQRELGEDTGIPLSMIKEYEQGRCKPGAANLIKIMNRLGISPNDLEQEAIPA